VRLTHVWLPVDLRYPSGNLLELYTQIPMDE
jgi:hypothetical protein